MATIIITGGTGLIGKALTTLLLENNHQVIVLSRSTKPASNGVTYSKWNIETNEIDPSVFSEAEIVIHLAGENVAGKRWTEKRKKEIRESRMKSSALLVKALKEYPNRVQTIISASAIGWYGRDNKKAPVPFVEEDQPSPGFLGETCRLWEESIAPVKLLGKRLVILRTGIVLSTLGGALPEFKKTLRFGLASILGPGEQIISWIHIEDLIRIYLEVLRNPRLDGVYNAVAPVPISNKRLALELAKMERGNKFLPVHIPSFALQLVMGEMSIEVLKSTTVSARKIQQTGFQFQFPTIVSALRNLV